MPVSMEKLGNDQFPERNSWLYGASVPVVVGRPNAAFSQKPNASASIQDESEVSLHVGRESPGLGETD
jgi:hypothetical protein